MGAERVVAPTRQLRALGVVVPVHNEESVVTSALEAIDRAIRRLPSDIHCRVAVVLDTCEDSSSSRVAQWSIGSPALVLCSRGRNVGRARKQGCEALVSTFSEFDRNAIWLATTDADSIVPEDWLRVQVASFHQGVDVWAGRVGVADGTERTPGVIARWKKLYASERIPIHGASLGFTASAYVELNGFRELRSGEDRDLYERAKDLGRRVHHDKRAVVMTSARQQARAPHGFAHALDALVEAPRESSLAGAPVMSTGGIPEPSLP
jgi:hypothetical protein